MKVTEMRHRPGKNSIVSSEALFQITRIIVRRSKFIKGKVPRNLSRVSSAVSSSRWLGTKHLRLLPFAPSSNIQLVSVILGKSMRSCTGVHGRARSCSLVPRQKSCASSSWVSIGIVGYVHRCILPNNFASRRSLG